MLHIFTPKNIYSYIPNIILIYQFLDLSSSDYNN